MVPLPIWTSLTIQLISGKTFQTQKLTPASNLNSTRKSKVKSLNGREILFQSQPLMKEVMYTLLVPPETKEEELLPAFQSGSQTNVHSATIVHWSVHMPSSDHMSSLLKKLKRLQRISNPEKLKEVLTLPDLTSLSVFHQITVLVVRSVPRPAQMKLSSWSHTKTPFTRIPGSIMSTDLRPSQTQLINSPSRVPNSRNHCSNSQVPVLVAEKPHMLN